MYSYNTYDLDAISTQLCHTCSCTDSPAGFEITGAIVFHKNHDGKLTRELEDISLTKTFILPVTHDDMKVINTMRDCDSYTMFIDTCSTAIRRYFNISTFTESYTPAHKRFELTLKGIIFRSKVPIIVSYPATSQYWKDMYNNGEAQEQKAMLEDDDEIWISADTFDGPATTFW